MVHRVAARYRRLSHTSALQIDEGAASPLTHGQLGEHRVVKAATAVCNSATKLGPAARSGEALCQSRLGVRRRIGRRKRVEVTEHEDRVIAQVGQQSQEGLRLTQPVGGCVRREVRHAHEELVGGATYTPPSSTRGRAD